MVIALIIYFFLIFTNKLLNLISKSYNITFLLHFTNTQLNYKLIFKTYIFSSKYVVLYLNIINSFVLFLIFNLNQTVWLREKSNYFFGYFSLVNFKLLINVWLYNLNLPFSVSRSINIHKINLSVYKKENNLYEVNKSNIWYYLFIISVSMFTSPNQ